MLLVFLAGCTDLLYGGDTVRVTGAVTSGGEPATGWEVRLMPAGTPNTIFDAAETNEAGVYRELVVFALDDCDDVRVATRPPVGAGEGEGEETGWTEKRVPCGVSRVDFAF